MELEVLATRAAAGEWASATEGVRAAPPIGSQLVVLFAFGGVAEDFVGFVDFLEFFFGLLFVFGDVGMELTGELAKGLFDVSLAGGAGHAESFVIIFVLDGHCQS